MYRREFIAVAAAGVARSAPGVEFRRQSGKIEVLAGGRLVSGFVYEEKWDKPFLYPLRTPSGIGLERGFPLAPRVDGSTDHPWHRGLVYGHGVINGIDFWRELGRGQSGRLTLREEPRASGNQITARLAMQPPTGEPIGTITQQYSFAAEVSLVSIEVKIRVMANEGVPLKYGDTEDGGFGMRLRDEFRQDRGAILRNSEGLRDTENIWGKPARWVDYSAEVEGHETGVAMHDHPDNLRYPGRWHARGYGLCAANPFALRDFTGDKARDGAYEIPAGGELVLRYKVVIHEGSGFDPEQHGW